MNPDSDVMKPLTSAVKRAEYAVVDIETKDGKTQKKGFTRPFLAGLFDGEHYNETKGDECLIDLLELILSDRFDGWTFYAHNGGGFDWLHMLHHIRDAGFKFEIVAVGSTIQMLIVKPPTKSKRKGWRFLDSYKLIPLKLADACHTFGGLEKLEQDLDAHEDDPSWSEYLRRDCEGLYDVLTRFHDLVETRLRGEVGITAASTSMKTFRRAYQTDYVQRHTQHHPFFRESYYGGRVEIFEEQGEGLHYYDLNSSYPAAMLQPVPVGEKIIWEGMPTKQLMKGAVGFARAKVDYPETVNIPCLPHRCETSSKLLFPVGRFEGVWPAVELLRAEEQGATVEWGHSIWMQARPILAPMVEDLYAYRDKSRPDYDPGLALTAKLLLNSLYGKFGMKTEREKLVILEPGQRVPDGSRAANPMDPDCLIWWIPETADAPYIIPQIAAHITALARLRLHDYLTLADETGTLAYCDTDSIITTAELPTSTELGALKDEGEGVLYSGEFLLPKLYCLKGDDESLKIGMKGYSLPKGDSKRRRLYERVKEGDVIEFKRLEKIGALAANGFLRGPEMRTVTKQLRSRDEKRRHLPSGTTAPIVLNEW